MFSIALIHSGKSFMPEIEAYQKFFESEGLKACILTNASQLEMEEYDVLWFFMGIHTRLNDVNKKKIIIHEYCSASTPPMARFKDRIKKIITFRPDLRVSLNVEHRGLVFPIDYIPLILRKQGVHECFFEKISCSKEYDFIYTGSAVKERRTDKWLSEFIIKFPDKTILLVGHHEKKITEQFRRYKNIHFKKAVTISELPSLLAMAHYAINYVPDVYPFNIQPSTKLLEYCAAGCNIISNKYEWVNRFCEQTEARFFFIENNFGNLSQHALESYSFFTPDMSEHHWKSIFKKMELPEIILKQQSIRSISSRIKKTL